MTFKNSEIEVYTSTGNDFDGKEDGCISAIVEVLAQKNQKWEDAVEKIRTKIKAIVGCKTSVVVIDISQEWNMWSVCRDSYLGLKYRNLCIELFTT